MKTNNKLIGTTIIAAILGSLCCVVPFLAILAGLSGFASAFTWLEPLRPYLIIFSITVLSFGFYTVYKKNTKNEIECDCENNQSNSNILTSKNILWVAAILNLLIFTFPFYSSVFVENRYIKSPNNYTHIVIDSFRVSGMTCEGCENTINLTLQNENGVLNTVSSAKTVIVKVKYDSAKISLGKLKKTIEKKTAYKIMN